MELDIHRIQQYRQKDDADLISDYVIFESLGEKAGVHVQRITAGRNEYMWRDDIQINPRYDLYFSATSLSDTF